MSEASRFDRIEELFHAVQALEPAKRVAFLTLACGADAALREEIESLLAADPGGTAGVRQGLASSVSERGPLLAAGDSVGPYRIVELIGEGGMGEVYRAEQSEPLARQVALKVIKAGMD
ncbi:MAG TPA: serine/threonine protein kinase, partial [Thermoanaerobaculia bacterium]